MREAGSFAESVELRFFRFAFEVRAARNRALEAISTWLDVRAVATPIEELSRLAASQTAEVRSIRLVERMLRKGEGLAAVPPQLLLHAMRALDNEPTVRSDAGLAMVHQRMRRQVASNAAREAVAESGQPMNWLPTTEARHRQPTLPVLKLSAEHGGFFESTIPVDREGGPQERVREREGGAANDSGFDSFADPQQDAPEAA